MLLYDLSGQGRSGDFLREADDYRRLAALAPATHSRRTPLESARWSAGKALAGLGKRLTGTA